MKKLGHDSHAKFETLELDPPETPESLDLLEPPDLDMRWPLHPVIMTIGRVIITATIWQYYSNTAVRGLTEK